jgi:hypothetical protein
MAGGVFMGRVSSELLIRPLIGDLQNLLIYKIVAAVTSFSGVTL